MGHGRDRTPGCCYARAKPSRSARRPRVQDQPTAFFLSGEAIRSRSLGGIVLAQNLVLPAVPAQLGADWERDVARLGMAPGEVEALSIARTRARWREYATCVQALAAWLDSLGLTDALAAGEVAIMACRGARYHHDAVQYGDTAFCNLFLSEDRGLDLHLPGAGRRIRLQRGCAVLFDTAQPHAVVPRAASGFREGDFAAGADCTQVFLSWELPIEDARMARALGVEFDVDPTTAARLGEAQVRLGKAKAEVDPTTGQWRGPPAS